MTNATVYQTRQYDISTDNFVRSRRLMTAETAAKLGLEILPNSAVEIPASDLEHGEGWTAIGYKPRNGEGFQTQVKAEMDRA